MKPDRQPNAIDGKIGVLVAGYPCCLPMTRGISGFILHPSSFILSDYLPPSLPDLT